MRIGIDAHVIGKNIGGVERYVDQVVALVPQLCPRHEFVIFVSRHAGDRFAAEARHNVRVVTLPASDPVVQRSVVLPLAVRRLRLDILHVQRIAPPFLAIRGDRRCRIMLTVHDLVPIKYPDAYPGFRDRLVRRLTPGSIARADAIVCPTRAVCDDIARRYPQAAAPRHAFYNGIDPARFVRRAHDDRTTLRRHGIAKPFLFSPGAIEARKNVGTIIEALAQLDPPSRPLLVLSGSIRDPGCFARLRALAQARGVAGHVRHLGFVAEADLIDLYGHAAACIAASYDEGFNFPPLEALACGAPVLCSDIPVHRELFDGAVRFFPPDSPALLAHAMRDTLAGRCRGGGPAAQAVIDRLSWTAMAHRMAGFFEDMAAA